MPICAKALPPSPFLLECFDYHPNGVLVWRSRPIGHFRTKRSWSKSNSQYAGKPAGTVNGRYLSIFINGVPYLAHRLIWAIHNGSDFSHEIDHINGDRFDNRIENLRSSSRSGQCSNRRISRNSTSGAKGVSWHRRIKMWQARVGASGKRHHLGYFSEKEQAAKACREFRSELHGEFANHG